MLGRILGEGLPVEAALAKYEQVRLPDVTALTEMDRQVCASQYLAETYVSVGKNMRSHVCSALTSFLTSCHCGSRGCCNVVGEC